MQTVTLVGSGKPVAAGTDVFTATAGALSCTFPITVTATAPPPSGNCNATAQGTYTAGTVLTAGNTISISHTYATQGGYTVNTNSVNGYSFGPTNITATAGTPTTIVLNGTGTPTAAGTNTFTVNFGDGQTCTFTVTVVAGTPPPPPNTDYFPTTLNSWWSYDDGSGGTDSFKMTNTGPVPLAGSTYQRFVYSDDAGPFDTAFYRKDAATGFYYESLDTAGFGPTLVFNQSRLDLLFLKNTLATGNTWNSDFNATATSAGTQFPAVLRFKYTCVNANASLAVNGKSFANVYHVQLQLQVGVSGSFQDAGDPLNYYYARGIGQIRLTDGTDFQDIRSWLVN
jgi:hypothetical protein